MKKVLLLFLAILAMAMFSVPVFAANWTTFENATGVKLSANVSATYAAGTSGASYSATTYNSKGTKTYGAASDSTWIYSAAGVGTTAGTSGDSSDFTAAGWESGIGA